MGYQLTILFDSPPEELGCEVRTLRVVPGPSLVRVWQAVLVLLDVHSANPVALAFQFLDQWPPIGPAAQHTTARFEDSPMVRIPSSSFLPNRNAWPACSR